MEAKIRAFLPAGIRVGDVRGRNYATGSPRRSITIMPPSEASRTNSEVCMWSSRTEVFLTMLHCSTCPVELHLSAVDKLLPSCFQILREAPASRRGWPLSSGASWTSHPALATWFYPSYNLAD